MNILPNLLRYQIMDALENPAKKRIQQMMNKIDVEKIIKEKVLEYEKNGMNMAMDFDFKFWKYSSEGKVENYARQYVILNVRNVVLSITPKQFY